MMRLTVVLCAVVVFAAASASVSASEQTAAPSAGAKQEGSAREQLSEQMRVLNEALKVKQSELAKLRHQWTVAKGRNPSADEVKEYNDKRREGKATAADNPFVNRNPLQGIAAVRAAYYRKKEEIRLAEERLHALAEQLAALKR